MPSKGVQVYTYIAVPGCIIELSVPGQTVVKDQLHQFWNGDLEVESSRIDSFFDKTGRFVFKVLHEGRLVTEQWVEVNALTGSVGEGTMTTISNTHSVVHPDPRIIVSYGFYESGHGHDILPNRHQCYITVTPDYSDWLGQVAPIGSPQRDQPFRRLVLPAAHDVGMNSSKQLLEYNFSPLENKNLPAMHSLWLKGLTMSQVIRQAMGVIVAYYSPMFVETYFLGALIADSRCCSAELRYNPQARGRRSGPNAHSQRGEVYTSLSRTCRQALGASCISHSAQHRFEPRNHAEGPSAHHSRVGG